MSQNIIINGTIHNNVDEIQIPKADGNGVAHFVDASNLSSRINVAQIFNGTATEINDTNGEITGALSTRVTNGNGSIQSLILPYIASINQEAVRGCGNLRYVEMERCEKIYKLAFYQCSRLEEAIFPSCKYIYDNETFSGCSSLTNAYFPELISVGDKTFQYCSSLVTISLPKLTTIKSRMFEGCSKLETINAPLATSINGEYVFSGCSKLNFDFSNITYLGTYRTFNGYPKTELYFPNVTSTSDGIFYGNTNIKKVTFDKLTIIRKEFFSQATNFETLVINTPNTVVTFTGGSYFNNTKIAAGTGTIYVPDELVNDYKTASTWSTYASQIKGVSELPQD